MTGRPWAVAIASVVGVLLILLLSPLLLLLIRELYPLSDWSELSDIGQSYTGIGTILSALAVIGALWSVALQRRQTRAGQVQVAREMQMQLMGMAIDNPSLGKTYLGRSTGRTHEDFSVAAYITLIFRYLHYSYFVGVIDERELRATLRDDFFLYAAFREKWERSAIYWKATDNPDERDFVRILDEEYEKSLTASRAGVEDHH